MPPFLAHNLSWFILGAVFLAFFWWKRPDVSSARARELVKGGARLIDVRSPAEFAAGHIEGAINIPVGEIARRCAEAGPADRPVILYCASGTRSAVARRALRGAGYRQAYNLGPMSRW